MREPRLLLFPAVLVWASALGALAQEQGSVTLAWDPSPSGDVAGYRVYFGGASRTYTNVLEAGKATTSTVSGLARGGTYYFAVTCYDTQGLESDFSAEASCTIRPAPGSPEVIELTLPVSGAVYTAPANIPLAATATSDPQAIRQVEFYSGATLLGAATAAPYRFSWEGVNAGNYSVKAVAVLQSGGTLGSAAVNVVVVAAQAPPAVTFAPGSGAISAPFVANSGLLFQTSETGLAGSGRAVYGFNITNAGNYTVSAMVRAPDEGHNSFYVNVDAEPSDPLMIWDIPICSTLTRHTVSWRGYGGPSSSLAQYKPKVFSLAVGTHQLVIRGREANTRLGAITIAAVPPRLEIRPAAGGGGVVLSGTGQPSETYRVLGSEDLATWVIVGTVRADSGGSFVFSDPEASWRPSRMYRALSIPVTPPSLRVRAGAGGAVILNAAGPAWEAYVVQRSQDLTTWTVVGTLTLDDSGQAQFSDPGAGGRRSSFYRLQRQ